MKNLVIATLLVLTLACGGNRQLESVLTGPGLTPGVVSNMGYCPDVASGDCVVRAWWRYPDQATGTEVYWLSNANNQVCFVNSHTYTIAIIGFTMNCVWRERRP